MGFHARPRFTKDLDIWVEPVATNAERVHSALASFGAPVAELTTEDLTNPRTVFQIGVAPNRIDILTALEGLDFAGAWDRRVEGRPKDVSTPRENTSNKIWKTGCSLWKKNSK